MSKFVIAAALGLGLLSAAGGAAQAHDYAPVHRPHVAPHHHHHYVPPPPPRWRPHHPGHARDWRHARQYGWR